MRSNARILPSFLALTGLATLLILSMMTVWVVVAIWRPGLLFVWVVGRRLKLTAGAANDQRDRGPAVLFLLVWEGGWFLIPADVAWLLVEFTNRPRVGRGQTSADARP